MSLGLTEMVFLLVIVLIFFGAGKLPTVMGDLAKGLRSFKQGLADEPPTAYRPSDEPPPPPPPARIEPPRTAEPSRTAELPPR